MDVLDVPAEKYIIILGQTMINACLTCRKSQNTFVFIVKALYAKSFVKCYTCVNVFNNTHTSVLLVFCML